MALEALNCSGIQSKSSIGGQCDDRHVEKVAPCLCWCTWSILLVRGRLLLVGRPASPVSVVNASLLAFLTTV